MKKKLILFLFFCSNLAVMASEDLNMIAAAGYQSSNSYTGSQNYSQDAGQKKDLLEEWLKAHPDKAAELKQILPNSPNAAVELQKWLDANPDCAQQLQQLVMPE